MTRLLTTLLVFISLTGKTQQNFLLENSLESTEKEVFDVILTLFDGMREADSSKVRSAFRQNATMSTSMIQKDGSPLFRKGDLESFIKAVGTPHQEIWDEPLWNVDIKIEDNLAMVWTEYAFYAGKTFSHCGVDAFMLNRDLQGWKIYQLTDTRKTEGCIIPEEISEKRDK